jgi:hypothetical protein
MAIFRPSESKKFDDFNDRYRERLPLEPDQI